MKMVVGLGNPGDEYVDTRHNIGFKVIDLLEKAIVLQQKKRKFNSRLGIGDFAGKKVLLLKPGKFMNRSGQAVSQAISFYSLTLKDLLVVCDDMNLDVGKIRLRAKGSAGGHKGLADIIEKLGTSDFVRLRIGIGRGKENVAVDYVLGRPKSDEKFLLDKAVQTAGDAVLCWIECGIEQAMNRFNVRSFYGVRKRSSNGMQAKESS